MPRKQSAHWISLKNGLTGDIRTLQIADELGMSEDEVFFALYRLAEWFAVHSKHGIVESRILGIKMIDRVLKINGFGDSLVRVQWAQIHGARLKLRGFAKISTLRKRFGRKAREALLAAGKCAACGATDALEIDHKIPVSRCGDSSDDNLQILCRRCNLLKGQKTMDEWMATGTSANCAIVAAR